MRRAVGELCGRGVPDQTTRATSDRRDALVEVYQREKEREREVQDAKDSWQAPSTSSINLPYPQRAHRHNLGARPMPMLS